MRFLWKVLGNYEYFGKYTCGFQGLKDVSVALHSIELKS